MPISVEVCFSRMRQAKKTPSQLDQPARLELASAEGAGAVSYERNLEVQSSGSWCLENEIRELESLAMPLALLCAHRLWPL